MSNKGTVFFKNASCGTIEKTTDGSFEFSYTDNSNSVSLTLPISQTVYTSEDLFPFFDGLIPEGWLLNLTEKNWKIPKNDRMTLLLTTCQDCVGAAHVLGENQSPAQRNRTAPNALKQIEKQKFQAANCLICMNGLTTSEYLYHSRCAKELFGFTHAPLIDISMSDMEQLALLQINQRLTLTGVQKKLSLSSIKEDKKERLTVVGFEGHFILKPSPEEYPEMAEIEHLSMKIAEKVGLDVAACGLVYLASGEKAYVTRRFDRLNESKVPMEDFCQLSLKPTSKKYHGSTESLGKVIETFSSQPADDKLTLFQIVLYSFWIGNVDMHLKNFSLWIQPGTELIRMSPGYDFLSTRLLISKKDDKEELALPINGKKNKLTWADFLALAAHLKIPQKVAERIRDRMLDGFIDAEELIEKSFLSDQKKDEFHQLLSDHSKRLIS